jgi:RNA polymerase sigma-70 factor (ECF subfamily)
MSEAQDVSPKRSELGGRTVQTGVWNASDEALLAGYATGDADAAAEFVGRFQAKAVGLALAITRDRVDAEEVAQDAFVRAWRYAASYDPRRGSVSGWLLTIVRNVALDRIRVASRRRELSVEELPAALERDDVPDPGDSAGERDAAARIVASMRSLPREQRDALLAVTLFGYTTGELSTATGVPLGTIKTRIRLGLRKLRDHLEERVR